eukprot:EG_transcript_1143
MRPSLLLTLLWALGLRLRGACGQGTGEAPDSTLVLQAGGATLPMSLYLEATFSYRFVQPNVSIPFTPATTDQAFCRLMNYTTECAAGDVLQPSFLDWGAAVSILTPDKYVRYPDLQLYPTVASAVAPIYNLNGPTDLVLTLTTLAKIWTGRITRWDHPEINATNPGFARWGLPPNQPITLVVRADKVGTTQVFKQALAAVDPVFKAQVGTSSVAVWPNVTVIALSGLQRVVSYVMRHPYSMGYAVIGDALANNIPLCKLNRQGTVVTASPTSVQYAVLELGMNFGNNGDNPTHLTADIVNAQGPNAWPISSYTYLAIRKSTLRPGATCDTVRAMMAFWLWFWYSTDMNTVAHTLGFSPLPEVVRDFIVDRFIADVTCGGGPVWQVAKPVEIAGYGPESADPVFSKLEEAYNLVQSQSAVNYTAVDTTSVDLPALTQNGAFVVTTAPPAVPGAVTLVFAGVGIVGVTALNLTLDGSTLARILNGDIATWLHADILALNPWGLTDTSTGKPLTNTAQGIVLLQGPTCTSAPFEAMMRRYYPAYTGAAIQAAESFAEEGLLRSALVGTPFAFSVTAFVGTLPVELRVVPFLPSAGLPVVVPSLASIRACASSDVYDAASKAFDLQGSHASGCYPLSHALYLTVVRQCPLGGTTALTVPFVNWVYSGPAVDAALQEQNVVPLRDVSAAVVASNAEALFQLSCQVRPTPPVPQDLTGLLVGIIVPVVVVLLLLFAGCGWFVWRVTASNRALRKQFSDDHVAEKCAEAIARFDLGSVAWLRDVTKPNKIQSAFLAIIMLLTEVKPYIPDQLLSQLMTKETATGKHDPEEDEDEEEDRDGARRATAAKTEIVLEEASDEESIGSTDGQGSRQPSKRFSIFSAAVDRTKSIFVASHRRSTVQRRPSAMRDWTHKRCTYMCVHFGVEGATAATKPVLDLVEVMGKVISIVKGHGASIDKVAIDSLTVHWGVAAGSTCQALQAIHTGLQILHLKETLVLRQHSAFWLSIGVGKGWCDSGTISAAGQRFFVLSGAEAALSTEVAMHRVPALVQTAFLVSEAVHQEVQFTVECLPRLLHCGALLFEPLQVRSRAQDDEWMYELRRMDTGQAQSKTAAMYRLFAMAKNDCSPQDVREEAAALRAQHGAAMSAQDHAALDLLL